MHLKLLIINIYIIKLSIHLKSQIYKIIKFLPTLQGNLSYSGLINLVIPDLEVMRACQAFCVPIPRGDTTPNPVTTTRRLHLAAVVNVRLIITNEINI